MTFDEDERRTRITVRTSTDGERESLRWRELHFRLADDAVCLQAYGQCPDGERYRVPFRDEPTGEETYGAGRYLDLGDDERLDTETWVLDFDRVYSHLYAYSEAYECPLVPTGNWLDVRIEAGEKTFEPA